VKFPTAAGRDPEEDFHEEHILADRSTGSACHIGVWTESRAAQQHRPGQHQGMPGCSEGNYTVAEDGTGQTFRITSSTIDLKSHVGHDVEIIGQKANVSANASPSDNSVIATGVNMISDRCTTATANAQADTAPSETAGTSASTDTTNTATASTPTASTPTVADNTPTATVGAPVGADSSPARTPAPTSVPVATTLTPAEKTAAPMTMASAKESTKQLPETASLLPVVGLLDLVLLGMGLVMRRLRTN